ncbi:Cystathionine beta-lyase [Nakaseomyces bracarensis]|uniref:cysteine-S-conjugate beta-lyase n=1 Tax=Nakaseomyces bracarensis TaxID=273131 RepID=A0ABR4P070_9SACH
MSQHYGASVTPLYLSTTFKVDLEGDDNKYDYTRSGNPTRTKLQEQVAKLYDNINSEYVFAVSSGMTALDVVLRSFLPSETKNHCIIAGDDLYGGTQRLLNLMRIAIDTMHFDLSQTENFKKIFRELVTVNQTIVDIIILESPTNPLCKIIDIPDLIKFIKQYSPNTLVVIDNTMMSGLNCNPLKFGADVVYESATKYLNGHHDIMAGVIVAKNAKLAERIYFLINSTGAGLNPMDSWLLIRGLKTLPVRLHKQQLNAMAISNWLQDSCGFKTHNGNDEMKTRFIGLKSHPDYDLHRSFNKGPGAVISLQTGSISLSKKIVASKKLKIWNVTVSFGCVNSLISMPCLMSHASIDPELRKERQFPEDLIRLCCGIENVEELQQDLLNAFVESKVITVKESNGIKYLVNNINGHVGQHIIYNELENKNVYNQFYTYQSYIDQNIRVKRASKL